MNIIERLDEVDDALSTIDSHRSDIETACNELESSVTDAEAELQTLRRLVESSENGVELDWLLVLSSTNTPETVARFMTEALCVKAAAFMNASNGHSWFSCERAS